MEIGRAFSHLVLVAERHPLVMAEDHLLHLDPLKCVQAIRELLVFRFLAHHFQDYHTRTGTIVVRHFVKPDPGLDVAPETGQYFLDFRRVLDPVLNMNSQDNMLVILHRDSPFTETVLTYSEYFSARGKILKTGDGKYLPPAPENQNKNDTEHRHRHLFMDV
jgi:hypothetical protein